MTEVWGKYLWTAMHSFSLVYPIAPTEADKTVAGGYFNNLPIPCGSCAVNYLQLLQSLPVEPALHSRADLVSWVFEVHNAVNESISKVQFTTDEFIAHYKIKVSEDGQPQPTMGTRLVGNGVWAYQRLRQG